MRKLLKALLFGLADFIIIAIIFFSFVSLKIDLLFVYILMIIGLIGYAIYLIRILRTEEIVKKETVEKLKPLEIIEKPKEALEIIPKPLFKEIKKTEIVKKEEAINFNEIIDYIKYNLYYGHIKERIINKLLNVGWTNDEVERAFSSL